ncbi:RrF2 family transcriptional regulator [Cohnella nanjingensis]|uniref:Rrf2 family transcriptional regulator n=1 Tax=Cohnella nanjingensis TaxID=1387779 RepID=A0A7X0VEG1_9BACL|nr:Rrf2 family transcriptional regulator [Cohnella nanjingensis]MBB6669504.1 Rrf2 family transcriptional regulator [Cohnella nanjingensis]
MDAPIGTPRFHATLGVLLLLSKHGGTLSSAEMAERLGVHAVYLRKIVARLLELGLVAAKEGRDGGYRLRWPADRLSLADAYEATIRAPLRQNEREDRWFSLDQVKAEIESCTMVCLKKYKISDVWIE